MGFFSWNTSDTNKTIWNAYTNKCKPAYLYGPNGLIIEELEYQGYGVFGGKDAYALLAEWNAPTECDGNVEHDRLIGIQLAFSGKTIDFPLKFSFKNNKNYDNLKPAESADNQGYFDWK